MIHYQVLYWRDIPAQVKVHAGRRPSAHALPPRFQVAIDRIAMQEGLSGSDAYLELWQWSEKREFDGDIEALLSQLTREGDAAIERDEEAA